MRRSYMIACWIKNRMDQKHFAEEHKSSGWRKGSAGPRAFRLSDVLSRLLISKIVSCDVSRVLFGKTLTNELKLELETKSNVLKWTSKLLAEGKGACSIAKSIWKIISIFRVVLSSCKLLEDDTPDHDLWTNRLSNDLPCVLNVGRGTPIGEMIEADPETQPLKYQMEANGNHGNPWKPMNMGSGYEFIDPLIANEFKSIRLGWFLL